MTVELRNAEFKSVKLVYEFNFLIPSSSSCAWIEGFSVKMAVQTECNNINDCVFNRFVMNLNCVAGGFSIYINGVMRAVIE
jgi:hypothetical protein